MCYIYPQIILSLAIGVYLGYCFRRQSVKNWTTLGLAIGFFSLALAGICQYFICFDLASIDIKVFYFLRYIFLVLGLSTILFGVMNLVTRSILLRYLLPIFIIIFGIIITYWGICIEDKISLVTLFISYGFFIPIDIVLGILFILLFSRLSFIKEGFRNNIGPLLIALGWFIHAVNMGRLYFILDKPALGYYMLLIAIPYVFWFVGFILLEKESKKALEMKMQIRGLVRKKQAEIAKEGRKETKGS